VVEVNTERDVLIAAREFVEHKAFSLMWEKNRDYAQPDFPIANYEIAATVAGCSPAQYIAGRMAEKVIRLGNVLARGTACGESALSELIDLQNFPGLIKYALDTDPSPPPQS